MEATAESVQAWRQRIGPVGVFQGGRARQFGAGLGEAAAEMEELGYGALWIGGGNPDEEAFADLAAVLGATRELVVAPGIANIWAWDPAAMHASVAAIEDEHPGRFLLGLGVSHAPLVEALGKEYRRPLAAMRDFLDRLDEAAEVAGTPPAFRVLAALRERMLELSRDRSGGAHPYFVPPQHSAIARRILGEEPLLAPEQAVVLDTDPDRAREIARGHMSRYLTMPNYLNSLRVLGFADEDFADGGSDRLVDAIVAWGTVDEVAARVREHLEAGADHVAIQPLEAEGGLGAESLRRLAPALRGR
jgi:probable F420-dependent oxidoreductase